MMVIEPIAGNEDLDAVAALEAECFTNPWTREMLARELHHSEVARVYVLRLDDHDVAAFCACWLVFDELHINTVAVRPELRRRGFATALMRYVMEEARRGGTVRATLEVRRSNEAARRLYERLGFSVAGVRARYYTHPDEDALILSRDMSPGDVEGGCAETPTDSNP
jgi:ribosomal-protein-alanine N-acetyltransferase